MNPTVSNTYLQLVNLNLINLNLSKWLTSTNKTLDNYLEEIASTTPDVIITQKDFNQSLLIDLLQVITTHINLHSDFTLCKFIYKLSTACNLLDVNFINSLNSSPSPSSTSISQDSLAEPQDNSVSFFDELIAIRSSRTTHDLPSTISCYILHESKTGSKKCKLNLIFKRPLPTAIAKEILQRETADNQIVVVDWSYMYQAFPIPLAVQIQFKLYLAERFASEDLICTTKTPNHIQYC
uniref:Uncharacterized protein n=1 Tax=Tetranychus urticae TaxID=32264 RepID=T1KG88_TETUR